MLFNYAVNKLKNPHNQRLQGFLVQEMIVLSNQIIS